MVQAKGPLSKGAAKGFLEMQGTPLRAKEVEGGIKKAPLEYEEPVKGAPSGASHVG